MSWPWTAIRITALCRCCLARDRRVGMLRGNGRWMDGLRKRRRAWSRAWCGRDAFSHPIVRPYIVDALVHGAVAGDGAPGTGPAADYTGGALGAGPPWAQVSARWKGLFGVAAALAMVRRWAGPPSWRREMREGRKR
jgi:hypothetical protein